MRLDVKALARDVALIPAKYQSWYSHRPGFESDYLMDHFVLPSLRGELVYFNELDLGAFSMEELNDMREFMDCHYRSFTIRIPCELGDMARSAPPRVKTGRAFC